MTTQNKREDWEERFNRKFGMAHGWDSKEFHTITYEPTKKDLEEMAKRHKELINK